MYNLFLIVYLFRLWLGYLFLCLERYVANIYIDKYSFKGMLFIIMQSLRV